MISAENQSRTTSRSLTKAALILLIWVCYNWVYLTLIKISMTTVAGYLALLEQVGLDLIISIFTIKLFKKTSQKDLKSIYLLFSFSAMAAAVSDSIYHISMNILDAAYFNKMSSFFELPFIFFLTFQMVAWSKLFFNDSQTAKKKTYHYLPYLTVATVIFFTFVCIAPWKINYLSKLGIYQIIDTFLEVTGFAFSTICLARSKNKPIQFVSIGYLFIISSDLFIRYDVISGAIPFLNPFESTWTFGLLLMALGFFYIKSNQIKLSPLNSLQSYLAIWLLNVLLLFILLFSCVTYFFPHQSVLNYLLVIIPCTFLAIICSKYFASKLLSPLERLELIIQKFLTDKASVDSHKIKQSPTLIEDFILLEKFIYEALEFYKKNHCIEIEYAKMATQVAHDIKAPMIALNNYFKDTISLEKNEFNVIESSLCRINEITNTLLTQYKKADVQFLQNNNDLEIIGLLLYSVIQEKNLQFNSSLVEIKTIIDPSFETACVLLNAENFKRTVSNLINNAIESIEGKGTVTISLQKKIGYLVLEIKDTGCGIPEDILRNIRTGQKINNHKGTGLGLPYALKNIREWGAEYKIESEKEQGTQFSIIFSSQASPHWLQEELYICDGTHVIICDTNYSVFKLWEAKILEGNKNISLMYISSPEELVTYVQEQCNLKNKLFLIDYHFNNSSFNGLEIIKNLNLNNAVLVTNTYPDYLMKSDMKKHAIPFVFKKNLPSVRVFNIPNKPDLILVDDKKLITETWRLESKKHGMNIVTFNDKNTLMKYIEFFDKHTEIFLDLNLANDRGDELAKNLHALGYKKLYITTGYDLEKINKVPWVLGFISKEPPFLNESIRA